MIGPLEIVIILLIIGVVFAGYFRKRLPQFGRTAGETARVGSEKAKELAAQAGDKAGDKWDPSALGKKAGEGVREAREIRDSFKERWTPRVERVEAGRAHGARARRERARRATGGRQGA